MADEPIYRPQKIDPTELEGQEFDDSGVDASNATSNQAKLNEMAQMRAAAAGEVGKELQNPQQEGQIQMSGQIPPQMAQSLAEARMGDDEQPKSKAKPRKFKSRAKKQQELDAREVGAVTNSTGGMRVTGSSKLEQLIAGIQSASTYEAVELPSRGVFYNGEDGPNDGIIHLRPMTGEEEQILATPRFVKQGKAINMIFNRCMQEQFNSENFLTQDRTYLLIYLRGISYTPEYDVEVRCSECDRKFATEIDLNSLYVDSCPPEFTEESLEDTLPTTGYQFRYRLSKGSDEQRVQDYRDRRMKGFDTAGQADDTLLYRTALLLGEIEGLVEKEEIKMLLKKLPINDVAYLRTVVNEPPFGVDTTVEITCMGCLQDFEIELPLEANFFFPRAKKKTQTTA